MPHDNDDLELHVVETKRSDAQKAILRCFYILNKSHFRRTVKKFAIILDNEEYVLSQNNPEE